jgi:hypothetical protein
MAAKPMPAQQSRDSTALSHSRLRSASNMARQKRKKAAGESKGESSLNGLRREERNLPAKQDAASKGDGKRYGRESHVTLRSFTSVSMW